MDHLSFLLTIQLQENMYNDRNYRQGSLQYIRAMRYWHSSYKFGMYLVEVSRYAITVWGVEIVAATSTRAGV